MVTTDPLYSILWEHCIMGNTLTACFFLSTLMTSFVVQYVLNGIEQRHPTAVNTGYNYPI